RNAHLSADFPVAGAGFGLFQSKRNLFFGIAGLFMAMCLSVRWKKDRRLQFSLALFSGRRSTPHRSSRKDVMKRLALALLLFIFKEVVVASVLTP
ncbi:hypothetical protein CKJ89_36165, partial [Klebsiella pneumoniae]